MAKKVRTIPATINRFSLEPIVSTKKRKTAGYARVSTDSEEQATSYESQMAYYKNYIESRSDWEFVGMYSDEGISATNTKRRDGFKQMISDALDGKVDLIVTKSVSRFARNTVDSLQTVRKLKENGIEVYFEKENIWTLDAKGELLITIMSSLAQEESRSISENTTWGKRKQFADGKGSLGFKHFLGYDKGFVINTEEAKTVKLIYKLYASGLSFYAVAKELTNRGIKTPFGKSKWHVSTVKSILTNEKYKGDALWQKGYISDFLQKTRKENKGEIPQYYVEEHHEAIIPPEQFDFIQAEIARRENDGRCSGLTIFSNKIKCGKCGAWYGLKTWHSNDEYRREIYRCNDKYKTKGKPCKSPHITEEEIKDIFVKALNSMSKVKKTVINEVYDFIDTICATTEIEIEMTRLEQELNNIISEMESLIRKNARTVQKQEEYLQKENKIREKYSEVNSRLTEVENQIKIKQNRKTMLENFIKTLDGIEGAITKFDNDLWSGLIDYILVKDIERYAVVFKNGMAIDI
ncbi:recombinase family protein [Eubacteriales bacterium KG125]